MRQRAPLIARWALVALPITILLSTGLAAAEPACNQTAGREKAHQMVEQCLQVSPATHPPCNAANACTLIKDEIRRGCTMLGKDAPSFCTSYRRPT